MEVVSKYPVATSGTRRVPKRCRNGTINICKSRLSSAAPRPHRSHRPAAQHPAPRKATHVIVDVWNARSAVNKALEVNDMIVERDLDVLCLIETWLREEGDDVSMGEMTPPGFSFLHSCLLYTSPSPRDISLSRMPSSA